MSSTEELANYEKVAVAIAKLIASSLTATIKNMSDTLLSVQGLRELALPWRSLRFLSLTLASERQSRHVSPPASKLLYVSTAASSHCTALY